MRHKANKERNICDVTMYAPSSEPEQDSFTWQGGLSYIHAEQLGIEGRETKYL